MAIVKAKQGRIKLENKYRGSKSQKKKHVFGIREYDQKLCSK